MKQSADAGTPIALLWAARQIERRGDIERKMSVSQQKEMIELIERAADSNVKEAKLDLSRHRLDPTVAATNAERQTARETLQQAANQLNPDALTALAKLINDNPQRERADVELAERYLRAAIAAGYVRANFELGRAMKTLRRPDDRWIAIRRGAEGGDERAQFQMYELCMEGLGSHPADHVEAKQWLSRASNAKYPQAMFKQAMDWLGGSDKQEWADGVRLLNEAAVLDDEAKFNVAILCLYGLNHQPIDLPRAEKLLRELADHGHVDASFQLGQALLTGVWLPQDRPAAIRYLEFATSAGNDRAANTLRLVRFLEKQKSAASKPILAE